MDHHAKLDWASRHIDALKKAFSDFVDDNPYRVVRNFDAEAKEHSASVIDVKSTPPDWSLMVGDIIHELRSALDNLTYALAVKNSGAARADASTRLQFPVADSEVAWNGRVKGPGQKARAGEKERIVLLSDEAQAFIKGLQPCYRPDKTPDPHPLSVLRDLSNTDKHRRLVLVVVKAMNVEIGLSGTGIPAGTRIKSEFRGPLEENAIIAGWRFNPPVDVPDMYVEANTAVDVEFGNGPADRQQVRGILDWFLYRIRDDIFPPLDKLLV